MEEEKKRELREDIAQAQRQPLEAWEEQSDRDFDIYSDSSQEGEIKRGPKGGSAQTVTSFAKRKNIFGLPFTCEYVLSRVHRAGHGFAWLAVKYEKIRKSWKTSVADCRKRGEFAAFQEAAVKVMHNHDNGSQFVAKKTAQQWLLEKAMHEQMDETLDLVQSKVAWSYFRRLVHHQTLGPQMNKLVDENKKKPAFVRQQARFEIREEQPAQQDQDREEIAVQASVQLTDACTQTQHQIQLQNNPKNNEQERASNIGRFMVDFNIVQCEIIKAGVKRSASVMDQTGYEIQHVEDFTKEELDLIEGLPEIDHLSDKHLTEYGTVLNNYIWGQDKGKKIYFCGTILTGTRPEDASSVRTSVSLSMPGKQRFFARRPYLKDNVLAFCFPVVFRAHFFLVTFCTRQRSIHISDYYEGGAFSREFMEIAGDLIKDWCMYALEQTKEEIIKRVSHQWKDTGMVQEEDGICGQLALMTMRTLAVTGKNSSKLWKHYTVEWIAIVQGMLVRADIESNGDTLDGHEDIHPSAVQLYLQLGRGQLTKEEFDEQFEHRGCDQLDEFN